MEGNFSELVNNSSEFVNNDNDTMFEVYSGPEAVVVPACFGLVFVTGTIGNVFLLFYILRKRSMTSHNCYVVSLAGGDLLMLSIAMPFVSLIYTLPGWPFGESICKLSEFMQTFCTCVTIYTIMALSVERYLIVSPPHTKRYRTKKTIVAIVAIWIFSFIMGIPALVSAHTFEIGGREFCYLYRYDWSMNFRFNEIMTLVKFFVLFIIPLFVIVPFYIMIFVSLIQRSNTKKHDVNGDATDGEGSKFIDQSKRAIPDDAQVQNQNRKRMLLSGLVLGLVVVFIVCWLPRHIFLIWFHLHPGPFTTFWHSFKIVGFCLMFTNSSLNPFVFAIFDSGFRKTLQNCCRCQSNREDHTPTDESSQKQTTCIVMADINHDDEPVVV